MLLKLYLLVGHALHNVIGVRHHVVLTSIEVLVVLRCGFEIWLEGRQHHLHVIGLLFFEFFELFRFDYQ